MVYSPRQAKRARRPFPDPELRRALAYILPYRRRLSLVLVLSLAGTGLSLYLPYLSKALVDQALIGQDQGALIRIVGLFGIVTVLGFVVNAAKIGRAHV